MRHLCHDSSATRVISRGVLSVFLITYIPGYNGLLYEEGRYNYGIKARFRPVGSKDLTYEDWMVNTRTDAEISAAVQNALQTLLPQIYAEIREEFHTSSGPSDSCGNPPRISHMEKIFDVMGCEDAFKTRLAVYKFEGNALAWWKAYKQAKGGDVWLITVTWVVFNELFFLRFFPRAEQEPASTAEEQAKKFQWGLRRSTLNHLMCIPFTDVAQVANAARNYEILHERDNDDAERPDKRQKSGDRHQPITQQSSHKNHGHNNDRHGSDRRGGGENYCSSNNNYSGDNNKLNFKSIRSASTHKHDPNITV
uniref:Zinc finger, CCHC-type, retrotransposon Gag domain protein n=1 Tax=Tanacetum cinerariifolium TaxID=118510 RepID=A0A699K7Q5_TANCI|nr:hypothetical protein [Tanacetum cinerariifolium]